MEDKRSKNEVHKNKLSRMFPFLFGSAFLIIIAVTVMTVASKNPSHNAGSNLPVQTEEDENLDGNKQIVAVLKEIDLEAATMTLLDIKSGQEVSLAYNGGTDIIDKYEQVIAASHLVVGEMVDAYYSVAIKKLDKLQISNVAWEYKEVNNWSIDRSKESIEIVDSKYKYSKNIVLLRQGQVIDILDLDQKDELTIKGYEREVWCILVTKGHGTLQLEDYDDFIGGSAYIGNQEILQVVPNMVITVQEGSYDITLENGKLKGTKQAIVTADENVIVNMAEFKKPIIQMGLVNFAITPEGAALYIDNLLQTYESAIELEYGEHAIKVILDEYTTYSEVLEVKEASISLSIDLVESNPSTKDSDLENYDGTVNDGTVNDGTENEDNSIDQTDDSLDNENNTETGKIDLDNKVYIHKPEGASIYFNGEFKGSAPVSFPKEIGNHYITLIKTGYETKTYTVEVVDDGEDVNFSFPEMAKSE